MLPKRTTCNSLSAYFDMATDPENSNLDLSPVSPELSVLSSSSAGSANIAPGSSLGPGIIKKFHHQSNSPTPWLRTPQWSDCSFILASGYAFGYGQFFLAGPQFAGGLLNSQLLLAQVGIHWFLPLLICSPCLQWLCSACPRACSHPHVLRPFSLGSSSVPSLLSLQLPFIVEPGFLPRSIQNSFRYHRWKFIDLAELLSVNLRERDHRALDCPHCKRRPTIFPNPNRKKRKGH